MARKKTYMSVNEFLSHKEDESFEGFAGNRFSFDFEEFESSIENLRAMGLDMDEAKVELLHVFRTDEPRLYSDTLMLPWVPSLPFALVEILMDLSPDEFGLVEVEDNAYMLLWWD